MIELSSLPALGLSLAMILGQPNAAGRYERPVYASEPACQFALALSTAKIKAMSIDPRRLACRAEGAGWIVGAAQGKNEAGGK